MFIFKHSNKINLFPPALFPSPLLQKSYATSLSKHFTKKSINNNSNNYNNNNESTKNGSHNKLKWIMAASGASVVCLIGWVVWKKYWSYVEPTPVTGRRRVFLANAKDEAEMADAIWKQIKSKHEKDILPENDLLTIKVKEIAKRLTAHTNLPYEKWDIIVIRSPKMNAYSLPGKIIVYSGITNLARNDDALAGVIAHEICHSTARHMAEGPVSLETRRLQEQEADILGFNLMALSCFNPHAFMDMWKRAFELNIITFDKRKYFGVEKEKWADTHPPPEERWKYLAENLQAVLSKMENASCPIHKMQAPYIGYTESDWIAGNMGEEKSEYYGN